MSQQAVVNWGPNPGDVELRTVAVPPLGDGEVLLEVGAVGVCGSDVHQWQARHSWPVRHPVVLGHEFCGTVKEIGPGADQWSTGDRVVSETHAIIDPNGPLTRAGKYNLDPGRRGYGAAVDGAMRSLMAVPSRILHHIPAGLSFEHAALTEPCCVAFNAVCVQSVVCPGDRILVLGPGPIGLLCAAMARLRGAEVAVVGLPRDEKRLAIATAYGAIGLTTEAEIQEWALEVDRVGVDGVIDAAGASAALQTAITAVRPAGFITKVGWGPEPLDFSLDPLVQKAVTLQGSFSHTWPMWERVLRLLAGGALDLTPIIGGVYQIADWETAFAGMHAGRLIKAILKPA